MKKLFAFIMILVLVFAFSGCGNKKTNITQTDDGNDAPYVAQNDSKNETSNTVISKNQSTVSSQKTESSRVESPKESTSKISDNKSDDKKTNTTQTDDGNDTSRVAQTNSKKGTSSSVSSKKQGTQSKVSSKKQSTVSSQKTQSSKVETSSQTSSAFQNDPQRPEKVTKIYDYEEWGVVPSPLKSVFHDSENGNTLPYCVYLPKNHSNNKKYPH